MKSLLDKKYGRLTVIEKTNKRQHREAIYTCKCDCGNIVEVRSGLLSQGKKRSCGCLYKETRNQDMDMLNSKKKHIDYFVGRKNKNNKSGFKGVNAHGSGYRAKITVKGKTYLGITRETKDEAYRDRLRFERELLNDL